MRHVSFEGHNETKSVADTGSEVEGGAQQPDHRNTHRQPTGFYARIECIALHDGVESQTFRLDRFLN